MDTNDTDPVAELMQRANANAALERHLELQRELYNTGSDRASAVHMISFVDVGLERLIHSKLRADLPLAERKKFFGAGGPAESFSARITLAYAFQFIGPISWRDLNLLRRIRNDFAHSTLPIRFTTKDIADRCAELKIVDQKGSWLPHSRTPGASLSAEEADKNHPRSRFLLACECINYRLEVKTRGVMAGDFAFENDEPLP